MLFLLPVLPILVCIGSVAVLTFVFAGCCGFFRDLLSMIIGTADGAFPLMALFYWWYADSVLHMQVLGNVWCFGGA